MLNTSAHLGRRAVIALVVAGGAAAVVGCSQQQPAEHSVKTPRLDGSGSRSSEFATLDSLAGLASAVVVGRGVSVTNVSLPQVHAPEQTVNSVRFEGFSMLSGRVRSSTSVQIIDTLGPDLDDPTSESALVGSARFLLFVCPYVFGPNDPDPSGAYVIVGSRAGAFIETQPDIFTRVDQDSPGLPLTVDLRQMDLPGARRTEAEVVRVGG